MTQSLPALCDEIERLEREATPGPWVTILLAPDAHEPPGHAVMFANDEDSTELSEQDAAFIAALRNAAPTLLSAARELAAIKGAGEEWREEQIAKFRRVWGGSVAPAPVNAIFLSLLNAISLRNAALERARPKHQAWCLAPDSAAPCNCDAAEVNRVIGDALGRKG